MRIFKLTAEIEFFLRYEEWKFRASKKIVNFFSSQPFRRCVDIKSEAIAERFVRERWFRLSDSRSNIPHDFLSKMINRFDVLYINFQRKLLIISPSLWFSARCWNRFGNNQRCCMAYDNIRCSPMYRSLRPATMCARKFIVWFVIPWISTSPTASIISSKYARTSFEVSRCGFHFNITTFI